MLALSSLECTQSDSNMPDNAPADKILELHLMPDNVFKQIVPDKVEII
jgi:hypothetical protein